MLVLYPSAMPVQQTITIDRTLNTVRAVVTDGEGLAVTGAAAVLESPAGKTALVPVPGQDGVLSASLLPDGTGFTLRVTGAEYVTYARSNLSVAGGGVHTFHVTLLRALQDARVEVTDAVDGVSLDGAAVRLDVTGTPGADQGPVTLVPVDGTTWTATFHQVPRGTYTAVYEPVTGERHHGTGTEAGIPVAPDGADLDEIVTAEITVDEHPVSVTVTSEGDDPPDVTVSWSLPDGAVVPGPGALAEGLGRAADGTPTVYYLPSSAVGTWTVTATPAQGSGYGAGSAGITMSAQGPDPAGVELTIVSLPTSTPTTEPSSSESMPPGVIF